MLRLDRQLLVHWLDAALLMALPDRGCRLKRGWRRHGKLGTLETLQPNVGQCVKTCYRASNWIHPGPAQGPRRIDRQHAAHGQAIKYIYVHPLCRHVRERLRSSTPPTFIDRDEAETLL